MSRKSGRIRRFFSRLFKERQIYHRSDGVVHFISMSSKTQIALAAVALSTLLWVAYASVNVVFKEQIIVAKERDYRVMETTFSKRINDAQRAYDDVNSLLYIVQQESDAAMAELSSRHEMLKNMVERKVAVDQGLDALSSGLAEAGSPSGQKPANGNRVMIDLVPAEPTPRQSRNSLLQREAAKEAESRQVRLPQTGPAANAVARLEQSAADLYAEQMLLLATLEEKASAQAEELRLVIESTGVASDALFVPAKISNLTLAQGGPFIAVNEMGGQSEKFFQRTVRATAALDELAAMESLVERLPLSSPLTVSRRFTSGYGVRRDPINGHNANHFGIDFAAAWASPVTATAAGRVRFAGARAGFGRTVEIDHGNGFVTRYAHLRRITVKRGQKVKLHDKVGELGSSGRSTGPHVHYEILYKGRPSNPRKFIEAGRYVFEG
ncbi:MAG: M23 family metallopeptidase [Parvularculaceae bacterium]